MYMKMGAAKYTIFGVNIMYTYDSHICTAYTNSLFYLFIPYERKRDIYIQW